MPASENLIAAFAASHAATASDKTPNNWLAGLHFWHTVNGATWHGADRRGFAKMVPSSSQRAKRPPVTIEALCILHDNLNPQSPYNVTVGAVALTAFWSCCRLGELTVRDRNFFDPLKHVSRSVLPLSVNSLTDESRTRYTFFHIPWSKTNKESGAVISVTARPHHTDPLKALSLHATVNSGIPAYTPLFSYKNPSGWEPLTKASFILRCNDVWVQNGFPSMPSHTFHIGGTTELLLQGVNPDVITVQGQWTSQAFLDYWRRVESVLPLFISSSVNVNRLQHVDATMNAFARHHNIPQV
ncbi:hypothetical protein PAXRUDRAFT_746987 [Paxillus rubicundulus Ve08.2h10]|uniref:Unplaced genomic scaffold scaffold_929, whole genome shotgun sequence n=1 Tax=Paxillus rubicundulus Ve08.2h10 TaxID=930991 RepID=A0A0D0D0X2_9AGAM|nr:hypothetical protein PAXRUDRAFT_746987 [Paxillus rubicundulus Ve08.2h10]